MTIFTEATLRKLWPQGDRKVPGLVAGIAADAPSVFVKYGFDPDGPEIAQAMAQFSHECGAGLEMTENVRYTAERAAQVWPFYSAATGNPLPNPERHFKDAADCYRKCNSYAGDPDFPRKLINLVYGTRMGNRPGTNDGYMYIGRGLSQLTGRENYMKLGEKIGLDLLNNPDIVSRAGNALECGVADFVMCGCLPYAKKDDTLNVTKRLNGGTIGLEERKAWLVKWKRELAAQAVRVVVPASTPAATHVPLPAEAKPVLQPKHAAYGAGIAAALYAAYHYFF